MLRFKLLIFLAIYFSAISYSQNYIIENKVLEKGLPFVEIDNIFQSKQGFIYLSGYAGITQYDGKSFKSVAEREGLDDYAVKVAVADKFDPSVIWIGTPSGLNKRSERVFQKAERKLFLMGKSIKSIKFSDDGLMFVTTNNAIFTKRKKEDTFKPISFGAISNITCSELINKHQFLIGTSSGLFQYDLKNDKVTKIIESAVKQIFKEGNTYHVCTNNGFFSVDYNNGNAKIFGDILLKGFDVRSAFSKYGDIYIATTKGLFFVNRSKKIVEINYGKTISEKFVNAVIIDLDDNLWLGTNSGVFKISISPFELFGNPPKDGSASFIFEIVKDYKGIFWVGSRYSGLNYLDEKLNFHHFDLGRKDENCYGLLQDKNKNLWIGTDKGLYVKRPDNSVNSFSSDIVEVQTFLEHPTTMWVGSLSCLSLYDKITFKELKRFPMPLSSHEGVICIRDYSANELLVGCYGEGLFLLNTETGKFKSLRSVIKTSSVFEIIKLPSGEIALASPIGIVILTKDLKMKKVICSTDGMLSDLIYSLYLDGSNLYAGSNQGMSVIDVKTIANKQVNIKSFNKRDGFDGIECNTNGFLRNENGSFLIGTVNGIYLFKPWLAKESETKLKATINNFKLFYKDTLLPDYCKLSHRDNQITFDFSSISFNHADRISYSFYLKGFDSEWTPATSSESATYSNLPPGEYAFYLKSNSSNGKWNVEATKFHFTILAPFWQKWWFIAVLILSLSGSIIFLSRARQLKIRKDKELLTRMVSKRTQDLQKEKEKVIVLIKEIHHRVKNNLQSITSLINLHSSYVTDEKALEVFEESKHRIKTMSLVHERLFETNDLNQVSVEDFITKIVSYLLESAGKENTVKTKLNVGVDKFHLDTIIPIGLFINEAISNTLKYAFEEDISNNQIAIQLKNIKDKQFELVISDNGSGFAYEKKRDENSSFGLELMGLLAEQVDGDLTYNLNPCALSTFSKGSTFTLRFFDIGKEIA